MYVSPALSPSMSHQSNGHSSLHLLTTRRRSLCHLLEGSSIAQAFSIRPTAGGCSPPNAGPDSTRIQDPSGISRQFVCALPARPPHPPNSWQPRQLPGQFPSEFPCQFAPQQHQPQSLIAVLCCISFLFFAVNTIPSWGSNGTAVTVMGIHEDSDLSSLCMFTSASILRCAWLALIAPPDARWISHSRFVAF